MASSISSLENPLETKRIRKIRRKRGTGRKSGRFGKNGENCQRYRELARKREGYRELARKRRWNRCMQGKNGRDIATSRKRGRERRLQLLHGRGPADWNVKWLTRSLWCNNRPHLSLAAHKPEKTKTTKTSNTQGHGHKTLPKR
jgi:hypothetical protein